MKKSLVGQIISRIFLGGDHLQSVVSEIKAKDAQAGNKEDEMPFCKGNPRSTDSKTHHALHNWFAGGKVDNSSCKPACQSVTLENWINTPQSKVKNAGYIIALVYSSYIPIFY